MLTEKPGIGGNGDRAQTHSGAGYDGIEQQSEERIKQTARPRIKKVYRWIRSDPRRRVGTAFQEAVDVLIEGANRLGNRQDAINELKQMLAAGENLLNAPCVGVRQCVPF